MKHTFTYINHGSKDVVLKSVRSSCGCTVADLKPDTPVAKGEKINVPVTIDVAGKSSNFSTSIGLLFDDPAFNIDYALHGTIFDEHPAKIDFGNVARDSHEERGFVLKSFPGQPPVRVLATHTQPGYGLVTNAPDAADERAQRISFIMTDHPPVGYFKIPLAIQTNDTEVPNKILWVTGYVLSDLELTKREIVFGRLGASGSSQELDLWSPEGMPVRLVRIENTREDVFAHEAVLQTERDHQPIRISLTGTIPPDQKSGIVKGVITFWADVGGVEKKDRVEVYASI